MKLRKLTILLTLLGLLLVAAATGFAQTPTQGDQKQKAEACCSMDSCCCCNGDSCDMKAKPDAKNHGDKSCCNMKHKHEKNKAKQKTA